ncbi:hypothetical protein B296_00028399 [Ensete ventricosum]|uniref:Uncharacterized protein n=1 Tax=Ensete ventricosum TaxID=4639 RepID=A0A426YHE8_ENSVE|nr:hypothetical protein B296_00028399 [Ensete ventricosum]
MRPYQVSVLTILFRGFSLSTDTLEVSLRFPLHLMIEACLEGWRISHSQMVPISWPYLVAFSWECHGGVKDMNEAWLAKAGLSPTTRDIFFIFVYHVECVFLIVLYRVEIFNLRKMKSGDGMGRGSAAPSTIDASASTVAAGSMVEKHPGVDEASSLRKRSRRVTLEQPANTSGSTTRVTAKKGKESMTSRRPPSEGIPSESYARWRTEQGQISGALHPILAKQVYECSSKELMNKVGKSTIWGLHFISALIDRVHDVGRLVGASTREFWCFGPPIRSSSLGPARNWSVIELHAKGGLEEDVNKLQTELESLKN